MEQPDGQPLVNSFDCPLYYLSRKLFTVDSSAIVRAVSMVHECGSSCKLQDAELLIGMVNPFYGPILIMR